MSQGVRVPALEQGGFLRAGVILRVVHEHQARHIREGGVQPAGYQNAAVVQPNRD